MPRFFFDIYDGLLAVDDEGLEFPDAHAARDAAIMTLPGIARDELRRGRDGAVSVLMRDADGLALFTGSLTIAAKWLVETTRERHHRSDDEQGGQYQELQREHGTD